jgi:fructose-bisphosphate aldolase, class II
LVLRGSSGVPDDELIAAVGGGMVKVSTGTTLTSAVTGAVGDTLEKDAMADRRRCPASAGTAMADTLLSALLAATTTRAR